jgi:hypothetical protein
MELLIPGLILVALMVYASTRIKKTAAAAFEAETVETEHFTFEKPEGLLLVLNGDPKLDAEGYSKEYGVGDEASQRQIRFKVSRSGGSSPEAAAKALGSGAKVVSRTVEVVDGTKFVELEILTTGDGFNSREFHKIGAANGSVFDFCVTSLDEPDAAAKSKIVQMISSFDLK